MNINCNCFQSPWGLVTGLCLIIILTLATIFFGAGIVYRVLVIFDKLGLTGNEVRLLATLRASRDVAASEVEVSP